MTEDEKDLFADFEDQFSEQDLSGVINFSQLTDFEISTMFSDVRKDLIDRGEMMAPTTDEGRDLHSQRVALLVEITKRKMR